MAELHPLRQDKSADRVCAILDELLRDYPAHDFAVELWDGTRWGPESGNFCRFTWHINSPRVLRSLFRPDREVALGESYVFGDFDINGDILAVFPVAEYLSGKQFSASRKLRLGALAMGLYAAEYNHNLRIELRGSLHSKSRDRQAVSFHYDVSNQFYKLWLDPQMVYSCAYFESEGDALENAQEQKLDYICRKLRLCAGERLLDIGCGWGGLIIHAARNYGVHATGVTLSQQQLALAQQRIREAGLCSSCEVRLMDYRDATELGTFDKLVSVGMVEHVGESNLLEYFRTAFSLLRPGGVFLNHGIGRAGSRKKPEHPTFTDVYVFPDAEMAPISTTLGAAEECGLEVRDLENLREHYYLTLVQWLRRLESKEAQAKDLVGDIRYRTWRLYLAGSAHYFRTGKLDLYQTLLVKTANLPSGLPLTRKDWYREPDYRLPCTTPFDSC
jgi:cyclopropane-fatty-acyl-phospholipid synthase